MRQVFADGVRGLDERNTIAVVLFHPGRYREDIGIEDDVLRGKPHAVDQDAVGAPRNRAFALERVSLALLVERHDHDGGAIALDNIGMRDEWRLALLERYGVHDRLALQTFQTGLDHGELRRVYHDRHTRDVGLGRNEVEKRGHRPLGIEQALVHVHVDDLCAVLDLLARNGERARVVAVRDQLAEFGRAGDVGALAYIDERNLGRERKRLEAGKPQLPRQRRQSARLPAGNRARDGADMLRRGAAAAADDIDQAGLRELAEQRS